jgi:CheY-like chemotaxis protein
MAYDISRVRFLVVEDNPAISSLFRSLLAGLSVGDIAMATSGEQAKGQVLSFKPDIVIPHFLDEI